MIILQQESSGGAGACQAPDIPRNPKYSFTQRTYLNLAVTVLRSISMVSWETNRGMQLEFVLDPEGPLLYLLYCDWLMACFWKFHRVKSHSDIFQEL